MQTVARTRDMLKEMSDEDLVGLLSTAKGHDRSLSPTLPRPASPYTTGGAYAPNYAAHVLPTPFSSPNQSEKIMAAPPPASERSLYSNAQRSLFSHTEEVSSPVPVFQDDSQHAFANEDEHRNHFQRIANLEESLKVSLDSQEALRNQIAKEVNLRKKCEHDLEACQQELKREREERKQEQEDMEQEMKHALGAVGDKAVKFVEKEIMAFNSTALELESKLRLAEKQRDEALEALSRFKGTDGQLSSLSCNECRLKALARHVFEKTIDGLISKALTCWRQVAHKLADDGCREESIPGAVEKLQTSMGVSVSHGAGIVGNSIGSQANRGCLEDREGVHDVEKSFSPSVDLSHSSSITTPNSTQTAVEDGAGAGRALKQDSLIQAPGSPLRVTHRDQDTGRGCKRSELSEAPIARAVDCCSGLAALSNDRALVHL